MPTRNLIIINRLGLHARAAAKFVERAQAFESTISLGITEQPAAQKDQSPAADTPPSIVQWVDGKSIMSVMLLAASEGTELKLRAEGKDAKDALDAIDALVASKFGETS